MLIEQDTLIDLCYYTIREDIEKPKVVRRFLGVVASDKVTELEKLLTEAKV